MELGSFGYVFMACRKWKSARIPHSSLPPPPVLDFLIYHDVNENGCACRLRELRTAVVGKLLTISGTVTRTSEVRPELLDGHFLCQACGTTIENIPQQFKYTEVHPTPAFCKQPAN